MSDLVREPLHEMGRRLIASVAAILRAGGDRKMFDGLREIVLRGLKIAPRFELRFAPDTAAINDVEIDLDPRMVECVEQVSATLQKRGFGGFGFDRAPAVEAFERYFVRCLAEPATTDEERQALRSALAELARLGIRTLGAKPLERDGERARTPKQRAFAVAAHANAALLAQSIADGLRAGSGVPRANTWKSALDDLVSATIERPNYALRLVLADHAQRSALVARGIGTRAAHATSTTALAVALGCVLGLEKAALADLAACAFFADLGYALLPSIMLDRDVELDPPERVELRAAMVRAFASVLGKSELGDVFLLRLLVALEQAADRPRHLFSRIVAVASAYDAITRDAPWRPAKGAREAIDLMLREEGRFDRRIVRALEALIEALGGRIHP